MANIGLPMTDSVKEEQVVYHCDIKNNKQINKMCGFQTQPDVSLSLSCLYTQREEKEEREALNIGQQIYCVW